VKINTNINIVQPKLVEHAHGARESVRRLRDNKHTESLFNSEREHLNAYRFELLLTYLS